MENKTLNITGMHCASCAAIIHKKVSGLDGVNSADVNFATEKLKLAFDPEKISLAEIDLEMQKYGYAIKEEKASNDNHITPISASTSVNPTLGAVQERKAEKHQELLAMKSKAEFVLPIALLVFVLMIWDILSRFFAAIVPLPLPMEYFDLFGMILATLVFVIAGKPFVVGVARFARYRTADMDTLIGIGTLTAFVYSTIIVLFPTIATYFSLPKHTYFDVTIVVIGFVMLGKYLEARSRLRTGEAIEKLIELQAKSALVLRAGIEMEIPIEQVVIGDLLIIKPGAKIPVDAVVLEGESAIDESMISGESMPMDKKVNDPVIGGTINQQGYLKVRAEKIGSNTMLSAIIRMVEEAQGSKAPIETLVNKISAVFVPTVLIIALTTLVLWLSLGTFYLGFDTAVSYGIFAFVGILVIACPCALGLATPTAIIVGVGKASEFGILVKNAEALQALSKINTVVLDKTGTITVGQPRLTDFIVLDKERAEDLLWSFTASLEKMSEHPLSKAIMIEAEKKKTKILEVKNFQALTGVGVEGNIDSLLVRVRKPLPVEADNADCASLQSQGKTVVVLEVGNKMSALIVLADTLKPETKSAIAYLKKQKIRILLLSGDNQVTVKQIAKEAGIDEYLGGALPGDKVQKIRELQAEGRLVAMLGDGVNDAPALAQADLGIAMATGSDIAIESAGIALLHGDISKLVQAIELSKKTMRVIKQNLFWAFIYNIIGIPLASGVFFVLTGWMLNPVFAGMAMALSSVSVVGNSLRLKAMKFQKQIIVK